MADDAEWTTAIADVSTDDVVVRGYPLTDLLGHVSFSEMAFLILAGNLPEPGQARMLDALFVSLADHGISPSSIVVRYLASCGTPIQAALAGATTSIADFHGGAGEALARVLHELVAEAGADEDRLRAKVAAFIVSYRAQGKRFEGFGHPQHPSGDPRAVRLLQLAAECGVAGVHVRALDVMREALAKVLGRELGVNINGALAAISLDLGFDWRVVRGLVIAPRIVGLTAHYVEELDQGGRWRHASPDRIRYTGPTPKTT